MKNHIFAALVVLNVVAVDAPAQDRAPADKVLLRLEPGGPTTLVTALAFSPDSKKLYAAGLDKVVRVWIRDDSKKPAWSLSDRAVRVPIGPGRTGSINALTVSPDGKWLAVGGLSVFKGGSEFDKPAVIVPSPVKTEEMLQDEGTIYAIDLDTGAVKALRGMREAVTNLAFAPALEGKPPLLVSTAYQEVTDPKKRVGQVRLWDVSTGQSVAELNVTSDRAYGRPGLAARHTGKGLKQMVVTLAWFDGDIRFWDIETNEMKKYDDGAANRTVFYHPGRQTFITAAFESPKCKLTQWRASNDRPLEPRVLELAALPAGGPNGPFFVPYSLAPLPVPDRTDDGAALIIRRQGINPSADDTEELALLNLKNGAELAGRLSLGKFTGQFREVSASPDGRYLAIADGDNNRVLIYAVADVLDGRNESQILRSVGTTYRRAVFVKKGADYGLALNTASKVVGAPPSEPADGDQIFDFAGPKLSGDRKGWELDAPDLGFWKARHDHPTGEKPFIAVRQGAGEETLITFPLESRITAYALAPSGDKFKTPLVAAAYLDKYRQTVFALYNAADGSRVRMFNGHVSAIRSVAFSKDGRLVVSASEDQTVSVWSLTKIDMVLGKAGRVPGLAVQFKDGKLLVTAAGADSPLKKGDLIDKVTVAGKVVPFTKELDFYLAVYKDVAPGNSFTVSVDGKNVELKTVQGVDERKPLLSLFVKKTTKAEDKPEDMTWIGWNPAGPYEVSSAAAEEYLGWHFNTGKADNPTSFAKIGEYKKDHEKKGILKHLVKQGSLAPALEEHKKEEEARLPTKPAVEFAIADIPADGPKVLDRLLVRQRDLTLRLTLQNEFPADRIASIQWQIKRDGETFENVPLRDFSVEIDGKTRTADLSKFAWKRGGYEFRAVVHTIDEDRKGKTDYPSAPVGVVYLPPPPTIAYTQAFLTKYFPGGDKDSLELEGKPASLQLQAEAKPDASSPEEKVSVRYRRSLGDRFVEIKDASRIDAQLDLQPGRHDIEIEAKNAGAEGVREEMETTRKTLIVFVKGPKVPPMLVLETATPTPNGASMKILPGQTITVASPTVRIQGRIKAEEALLGASVKVDAKAATDLKNYKQVKDLAIDETVTLEPGTRTVAFTARTANSPEPVVPIVLTLKYIPQVDRVTIETPGTNDTVTTSPAVLRTRYTPNTAASPSEIEVLVDGAPQKNLKIDEANGTLTAELRFEPGKAAKNVVVHSRNKYGSEDSTIIPVYYRRPPRIDHIDAPEPGAKPLLDYVATVESPKDLPLTGRVKIDGNIHPPDAVLVEKGKKADEWRVTVRDVNLKPGRNIFNLQVANDEELSMAFETPPRKYEKPAMPPAPRPVVQILSPDPEGVATDKPVFPVRFEVSSSVPLRRVRLMRGSQELFVANGDKVVKNDAGYFEIKKVLEVPLLDGNFNTFRLEAVNDGGESVAHGTVDYKKRPVRLVIDRFQSREADAGNFLPLPNLDDGHMVFDKVGPGRLRLYGRVIWIDEKDKELREAARLRVFVNGFQQIPVMLYPPEKDKHERRFEVDVLLNRAENNVIDLELPDLPKNTDYSSRSVVQKCVNPVKGLRLHLLIVGIGNPDAKKLERDALDALRAKKDAKTDKISAPPTFDEVIVYGPLAHDVSRDQVFRKLDDIKWRIDHGDPRAREVRNDLVMMYYQGKESITPQGHYFLTDDSKHLKLEYSGVSLDRVTRVLADTRGAQLVLLDVVRVATLAKEQDQIAQLSQAIRRIGFIRLSRPASETMPANSSQLLSFVGEFWPLVRNIKALGESVAKAGASLKQKEPGVEVYVRVPDQLAEVTVSPNSGRAP